jgi:hypothetical protein
MTLSATADKAEPPYRAGRTWGAPGGVAVLVTRETIEQGELTCDGEVLTPQAPPRCSEEPTASGTIRPGDRLTDPGSGLEVLCTRGGQGLLAFRGKPMLRA